MTAPRIRDASTADLPAVVAIYNYEVANGVATFDTVPWTVDGQRGWLADHGEASHPLLVAERDGHVVGWGTLSAWSTRSAYARTAETSVYVDVAHRGTGVGRALLAALVERARRAGLAVLLARIETSGSVSLALHARFGFERIGTMHGVGEKLGRVLDVDLLELQLEPARRVLAR